MITIQQLKFLDLFSGIGGFRLGMERANNKCVGWCDIDKFARKSYKNMYDTRGEWIGKDINAVTNSEWRKINKKYGKINVICGGFPCQSFSIAGKRKGFLDKTRGTLFFQIARAAKEIKPQYLFLENVKGLLNHRHGKTFATILSTLDEIGYDAEWRVFNSKDFGVPQNRERVYIIGHLRGSSTAKIFHPKRQSKSSHSGIKYFHRAKHQAHNIYQDGGVSPTLSATDHKHPVHISYFYNARKHGKYGSTYNILNPKGISTTLSTMQGGNRQPKIAIKNNPIEVIGSMQKHASRTNGTYSPTLTSAMGTGGGQIPMPVFKNLTVRKLTPRECWRLQGYPDKYFDRAKQVNSNSQLYKQAGNSVSVPVIEYIAKRMKVY